MTGWPRSEARLTVPDLSTRCRVNPGAGLLIFASAVCLDTIFQTRRPKSAATRTTAPVCNPSFSGERGEASIQAPSLASPDHDDGAVVGELAVGKCAAGGEDLARELARAEIATAT